MRPHEESIPQSKAQQTHIPDILLFLVDNIFRKSFSLQPPEVISPRQPNHYYI